MEGDNFTVATAQGGADLTHWLHRQPANRTRGPRSPAARPAQNQLRFAFYGRVSTADRQEPAAFRQWQSEVANQTIGAAGTIVREFFDIGCSRSTPWPDRPQAQALLGAIAGPDRGFDAIVVGESDRAFSGTQLEQLLPTLRRHRVALWLPELDGALDPDNPVHQALVSLLGHDARREVLRARHRTLTAMRVLVRDEGRFLGGRPPYGYRVVDTGPHPNPLHAAWGRRIKRLDPDPATAGHVRWIFTQRLAGHSPATIAGMLTRRGVPRPSGSDSRRDGNYWSVRAVDTILGNPRYTGRQVWDRQGTLHHENSPGARHTSAAATRRANSRDRWVVSTAFAHPPLISEAMFVAAQQISSIALSPDTQERCYLLAGLVICGVCERRAESHWAHGRAAYRCRHGHRGARPADSALPFYAREDALLAAATAKLAFHIGHRPQALEPPTIADYLRQHGLTLRCTRDSFLLDGSLPELERVPIPGIFGVDQSGTIGTSGKIGTQSATDAVKAKAGMRHGFPVIRRRFIVKLRSRNDLKSP